MNVVEEAHEDWNGTVGMSYLFNCPGCGGLHFFKTSGSGATWTWNGDKDKPTVSPSIHIKIKGHECHFFIKNGMIEYLNDCHHKLAGQTVPMEPM